MSFAASKSPQMVAGPVTDLLSMSTETYIEYKNAAGDTLRFKTFARDGVKMVSLNGIELPLDELFDIIQEVDSDADRTDENDCDIALACAVGIAISFIAIMLYMRYVFLVAF